MDLQYSPTGSVKVHKDMLLKASKLVKTHVEQWPEQRSMMLLRRCGVDAREAGMTPEELERQSLDQFLCVCYGGKLWCEDWTFHVVRVQDVVELMEYMQVEDRIWAAVDAHLVTCLDTTWEDNAAHHIWTEEHWDRGFGVEYALAFWAARRHVLPRVFEHCMRVSTYNVMLYGISVLGTDVVNIPGDVSLALLDAVSLLRLLLERFKVNATLAVRHMRVHVQKRPVCLNYPPRSLPADGQDHYSAIFECPLFYPAQIKLYINCLEQGGEQDAGVVVEHDLERCYGLCSPVRFELRVLRPKDYSYLATKSLFVNAERTHMRLHFDEALFEQPFGKEPLELALDVSFDTFDTVEFMIPEAMRGDFGGRSWFKRGDIVYSNL